MKYLRINKYKKKNFLLYLILLITLTIIIIYFSSIDYKKLSKCPSLEELISLKNFKIEEKFKKFHNFKGYDCDSNELWKKVVISVSKKEEIDDINQQINNFINFIYLRILNIENIKVKMTPVDNNNQMIFHPIKLLELRHARCGQHARILVDGLKFLDVKSRVVQLNGHLVAEYLNEKKSWIMIDLTYYPKNKINYENKNMSLDLILSNKFHLNEYLKFIQNNDMYKIFNPIKYNQFNHNTPYVIKKIKNKNDKYFGWGADNYVFCLRSEKGCFN